MIKDKTVPHQAEVSALIDARIRASVEAQLSVMRQTIAAIQGTLDLSGSLITDNGDGTLTIGA